MKKLLLFIILLFSILYCQKQDDSEELFLKAEGFLKLNMYKEALEIYIELKSRDYKTELVQERIKFVSSQLAKEKLKAEAAKPIETIQPSIEQNKSLTTNRLQEFKVSRCDQSYNERIEKIKNEMKPYQDELSEIEKRLAKISSEYKVVYKDGIYSIAVPADTPKEKQKEIAEGPAREFGTLNARKNELLQQIEKYNAEISKVIEESKKAGVPSDCIKR